MEIPPVTVVMINYNKENYLGQSLESYLKQTYQNKELIVVDDGSTDGSVEILKKYEKDHSHIRVFYLPHSGSTSKSWNFANTVANGKYILNLDSDDILYSDAVEVLANEAEKEGLDVCFGSMIYMDEIGSPLQPESSVGSPYEYGRLIKHMYLSPPRLYRKSIFDRIEGYNPLFPPADDWDLFLQIEEKSDKFGWTGKRPLYCYRRYSNSYASSFDKKKYQELRESIKKNARRRRNTKRILVLGRKWDEDYVLGLRKQGHDVVSFFETGPEVAYLEQFSWSKQSWRRLRKILKKFNGDLILIKERLPLIMRIMSHLKAASIPEKRLYLES